MKLHSCSLEFHEGSKRAGQAKYLIGLAVDPAQFLVATCLPLESLTKLFS